jgi:hypothetical protein
MNDEFLEEIGGLGLIQLFGGAQKSHEKSVRISGVPAEVQKEQPPPPRNMSLD